MRKLLIVALAGLVLAFMSGCPEPDSNSQPSDTSEGDADTSDVAEDTSGGDTGVEDTGDGDDVEDTTESDTGTDTGEDTGDDAGDAGDADTDAGSPPVCGDGIIEGDEQCDDKNQDDDDGCSSSCVIEVGWSCSNAINLNTGSDGAGGQLGVGSTDSVWTWAEGTLNSDGSTPDTVPSGLTWTSAETISECVGEWHDATEPAQWVNSTGWDSASGECASHPNPTEASLRYYRATFDIADSSAAEATSLSGKMWADNQVTRIFINGAEVTEYEPPTGDESNFLTGDATDFGTWGSSYYQAGENEIVIAVKNLANTSPPNPEGLLVRVPDAFTTGSVCTRISTCGDGVIEGYEECDDNNTDDGDGCSSSCDIESGFGCTNAVNLNTGSDGQGGQLSPGDTDNIWTWAQGTLNSDGSTPDTMPSGLTWNSTTVIAECVGPWHDATAPAQWINSLGWNSITSQCEPHPNAIDSTLRYYRATFNIPNADAAMVTTLSGEMWADNQATRIFINGTEVTEYQAPSGGGSSFQTADAVDFGTWGSGYYQAGENEIVIAVKNLGGATDNPEGLLVRVPDAFQVGSVCSQL